MFFKIFFLFNVIFDIQNTCNICKLWSKTIKWTSVNPLLNPRIKMTNIECAHFQSDYYPELCMSFLFKNNFIRYVYIPQECIIWVLLFLRVFFVCFLFKYWIRSSGTCLFHSMLCFWVTDIEYRCKSLIFSAV